MRVWTERGRAGAEGRSGTLSTPSGTRRPAIHTGSSPGGTWVTLGLWDRYMGVRPPRAKHSGVPLSRGDLG